MRSLFITTAAIALIGAAPAFAQLGGALGGTLGGGLGGGIGAGGGSVGSQIGGSVGGTVSGSVGQPDLGGVRDTTRGAAQGARDTARGVGQDVRDTARSAAGTAQGADVNATVNGNAGASASQNGVAANGSGDVTVGTNLKNSAGETLGSIVGIVRNRAGQITSYTLQTADGVQRTLPPAALRVEGDAAVTSYSGAQVNDLPRAQAQ